MRTLGKFLIICSVCMLMLLPSCVREQKVDQATGQTTTVVSADPCAIDTLVKGGDMAVGIMTLLTPFFPYLAPITTGVAGIVLTLKQQKPKLVKAQTKQKMYHTVASSAVLAIDNYAKANPAQVASLLEEMERVKNRIISPEDRASIENVIRALRGKPPKEEALEA